MANNLLNNMFGGKDSFDNFPTIYEGQKSKSTSSYVEDPNDEDLDRVFGRKPLENFPTIRKNKENK